jgi:hypothetical protein
MRDLWHRVIPDDPYGWSVALLGGALAVLFPAQPAVYQGLFLLIALDTLLGWMVAGKKGTRNSKTFRRKFFPKLIQYLLTITVLYTAKNTLSGFVAEEVANMLLGFTLAAIVYTEVKSILENLQALTGTRTRLIRDAEEMFEFLEAHHLRREDAARPVPPSPAGDGEAQPGPARTGPDSA